MNNTVVTQGLASLLRAVQADNNSDLETALVLYKQGLGYLITAMKATNSNEDKMQIRREMHRHIERVSELQEKVDLNIKRKKMTEQDRLYHVVQFLSPTDLKNIILAKLTQVQLNLDNDPGVQVGVAGLSWFLPPFEFPYSHRPKSSTANVNAATTPRSRRAKGIQSVPRKMIATSPRVRAEDASHPNNLHELLEILWGSQVQRITLDRLDSHYGPFTPLQWAAGLPTSDCVLACLEAGAKVDKRSRVLLPQASLTLHGYSSTLQEVYAVADYTSDAEQDGEWTALMLAVMFGTVSSVALLVEAGSDIYAVSAVGRSAVDFAYIRGDADVIDVLEEAQLEYENDPRSFYPYVPKQ